MPPAKLATIAPWRGWVFQGSGKLPRWLAKMVVWQRRVARADQFRSAPIDRSESPTGYSLAGCSRPVRGSGLEGLRRRSTNFQPETAQHPAASVFVEVAAVRIGMPASASLPPFCDWPADLAELVRAEVFMLDGGHDYDGRPIMPFDEAAMRAAARDIRAKGTQSVGVASIFSPLDPAHEDLPATSSSAWPDPSSRRRDLAPGG